MVKELGSVPVGTGTPQVSLNRGVIQGALTGWSAINTFRITPSIKSHLDLPMGVRSFFIAVRKRIYDKLPEKRGKRSTGIAASKSAPLAITKRTAATCASTRAIARRFR